MIIAMNGEMLHIIPVATAAAGYAAGRAFEYRALKEIEAEREALIPVHEGVEASASSRPGILVRSAAQLAIIGAVAGLAYGEAFTPHEEKSAVAPVVAVAIDHSFETRQDGADKKINKIAGSLIKSREVQVQTYLAHNGSDTPEPVDSVKEISNDDPYGPQTLNKVVPAVMGAAYNSAAPVYSNQLGTAENRSAATLVLTDNGKIGDVRTIVSQAEAQGKQPVYVVNVGHKSGSSTSRNLKTIAEQTDGHYWAAKTADANTITHAISQEIKPRELPQGENSIWPWKKNGGIAWLAAGVALSGAWLRQLKRRKRETVIS
jgi:hypothetical protein